MKKKKSKEPKGIKKILRKQNRFQDVLGDDGMRTYKLIFDQNNTKEVNEFLKDDFIRALWPIFCEFSEESFYFKAEKEIKKSTDSKAIKKDKTTTAKSKKSSPKTDNTKLPRARGEVLTDLKPTL